MTFKAVLKLFDGKLPVDYALEPGKPLEIAIRSKARGFDLEIETPAEDMSPHQVKVTVTSPKGDVTQESNEVITPVSAGMFIYRKRVFNLSIEGVYVLKIEMVAGAGDAAEGALLTDGTQPSPMPRSPAEMVDPVSREPNLPRPMLTSDVERERAESERLEHEGGPLPES